MAMVLAILFVVRSPWSIGETGNLNGQPVLLKNKGNRNKWLTVRLTGITSNSMGIGARIEVFTRGRRPQVREIRAGSSFASTQTPWPTFGLGRKQFALIKVRWFDETKLPTLLVFLLLTKAISIVT